MGMVGQIALGVAGAVVGGFINGPTGAFMGFSLGYGLGGILFPVKQNGPDPTDIVVQESAYGQAIPWNYSMFRQTGNVIWRGVPQKVGQNESAGGKGGPSYTSYYYTLSFAVGLCEGPIQGIRRIWANGTLIYDISNPSNFQQITGSADMITGFTVYLGDENQMPDPTIEAELGAGNVPPFRGLAYVVFQNFSLQNYGGYMPQLSFEIVTGVQQLSSSVQTAQYNFPTANGDIVASAYVTPQTVWSFVWSYPGGPIYSYQLTSSGAFSQGAIATLGRSQDIGPWYGVSDQPGFLTRVYNPFLSGSVLTCGWYDNGSSTYGSLQPTPLMSIPAFNGGLQVPWYAVDGGDVFAAASINYANNGNTYIYKGNIPNWSHSGPQSPTSGPGYSSSGWQFAGISPSYVFAWDTNSVANGGKRLGYFSRVDLSYIGDVLTTAYCQANAITPGGGGPIVGSATDDNTVFLIGGGGTSSVPATIWKVNVSTNTAVTWLSGIIYPGTNPNTPWQTFKAVTEDLFMIVTLWNPGNLANGGQALYYIYRTMSVGQEQLSAIVADMCTRSGLDASQFNVTSLTDYVIGYGVTNHSSMRSNIGPLQSMYQFDVADSEGQLKFVRRGSNPVGTIYYEDLGVASTTDDEAAQNPIVVTTADEIELSRQYSVSYYGANNDYQQNTQYSFRPSATVSNKDSSITAPLVMADNEALARAQVMLWAEWLGAKAYTFNTDLSYLLYEPTDVVNLQDETGALHVVRLTKCSYDGKGMLKWEAVAEEPTTYIDPTTYAAAGGSAQGQTGGQSIPYGGASNLIVLDCSPLRDQDNSPGLYIAVGGPSPSWQGAQVNYSRDGTSYTPLTATQANTPVGTAITALAVPPWGGTNYEENEVDYANTVQIQMYNGQSLYNAASFQAFLNGANVAMLGNEIIFFQNATANGSGLFTLSNLLRGRQGTEWAASTHATQERFVLLGTWLLQEGLNVSDLGNNIWNQAQTISVTAQYGGTIVKQLVANGRVKPLTVSKLRAFTDAGSTTGLMSAAGVVLNWVRRARIANQWIDNMDVPLDEKTESYTVSITNGSKTVTYTGSPGTTWSSSAPFGFKQWGVASITNNSGKVVTFGYTAAMRASDGFGSSAVALTFTVWQNSDQGVPGYSRSITATA